MFLFFIYSRIHAVCICYDSNYFYGHVDQQLESLGLTCSSTCQALKARGIIDIIDGYKGRGYSNPTDEELSENDVLAHLCTLLDVAFVQGN